MNWNLKCRRARHALALWSGNDLDAASQGPVQRHLAVCPHCRERWRQLQAGQQALEQVRSTPMPLCGSVWPAVERQLRAGDEQAAPVADWRGWLPTGALAAACLTLLLVFPPPTELASPGGEGSVAGPPVIFSQSVGAPIWQLENPSQFEQPAYQGSALALPDVPRVRILLDGTDVRGL